MLLVGLGCSLGSVPLIAQIDPDKRQLVQLGYNQPLEGRSPTAGYAYYYFNQPGWVQTNLTLRLAVAPVYLDSELGIGQALGPQTDLAVGLSGGGFAYTYSEIQQGKWVREESFTGHGGEATLALYHRFNPDQLVPLSAVLRASGSFIAYERDDETAPNFVIADDRKDFRVRTGLRLGGREPTMMPSVAMEISAWYEGQFRTDNDRYGYNGDREVEDHSHLFLGRAMLIYTLPKIDHNLSLNITGGTTLNPDRFSAYRPGGDLPLASEFPLSLPGYFYQELSARTFVMFNGQYLVPLTPDNQWGLMASGSVAGLDYLDGFEQPGDLQSGVGANVVFRSKNQAWQIMLGYGYGISALRNGDRGAHSIGILIQYDLEADSRGKKPFWDPWLNPNKWRGFDRLFGR